MFSPAVGAAWPWVLAAAVVLIASLALIRLLPAELVARGWPQTGLFIGDAAAATLILSLTGSRAQLYLIYLLIVFGSALTRSLAQRWVVAAVTIGLYLTLGRLEASGWPIRSQFWLQGLFLAVSAVLMTLLAQDSRQAEEDQRRRYEERLISVGRLATLGRVAGEVAHQIKGPLTTISVDAEVLSHRLAADAAALKDLREIRDEVERCKTILKSLLDLGRIEEMDVAEFDLRRPLRAAIKSLRTQARHRGVRAEIAAMPSPLAVRGDESLLQQALAAILQNALEAVGEGGRVSVRAGREKGQVRIVVEDDGVGISPENLEKIFEPFFTTKPAEGSGLGLSAALRIAAKHGGGVEAESEGLGRGARVTLSIPAA